MKYSVANRLLVFLLLSLCGKLRAQNLFINPGFEDINTCVEYNAPCAPEGWFNVPATNFLVTGSAAAKPKLGHMVLLLPVGNVLPSFHKERFTYTMLGCPLVKDEEYELSFFISSGKKPFNGIDLYFLTKEPGIYSLNTLGNALAVTVSETDIDAGDQYWQHVHKRFKARGNEGFCLLANKSTVPLAYTMKDAMNSSGDVFYFLDEMRLKPVSGIPLCDSFAGNVSRAYAQNYRHTESKIGLPEPVVVKKPFFTRDTITIPAVLFDVNSVQLKPEVKRILDSVIQVIGQQKIAKLEINGHADISGSATRNEQLATGRAISVKQYFSEKLPAMAESMFATGKGSSEPVADNNTVAGRMKNRRVEVIITRVSLNTGP